jgi:hypothetical protein
MQEMKIELHYQVLETKISAIRHKQQIPLRIQALGWSPNGRYIIPILYSGQNID